MGLTKVPAHCILVARAWRASAARLPTVYFWSVARPRCPTLRRWHSSSSRSNHKYRTTQLHFRQHMPTLAGSWRNSLTEVLLRTLTATYRFTPVWLVLLLPLHDDRNWPADMWAA